MPRRRADGPARNGPDVVLELIDRASVERPVPRIVHARRDLLTTTGSGAPSRHHEEFNAQHTAIAESLRDARRHVLGERLMLFRATGGNGLVRRMPPAWPFSGQS